MQCSQCGKNYDETFFVASPFPGVCNNCCVPERKKLLAYRKRLPKPPKYKPDVNQRVGFARDHFHPPPPPLDACFGDIAQDQELVDLWNSGGRSRGGTIQGVRGPRSWDAKNKRHIRLVDPAFPETLQPYEDKWASESKGDPYEACERRILDADGLVMTAREFILLMDFERRNWVQLNTLYWVPYDFRDYLQLCKRLVDYEYANCLMDDKAGLVQGTALVNICLAIHKLVKPMTQPSLASQAANSLRSEQSKAHRRNTKAYRLRILGCLGKQCRNELNRLKDELKKSFGVSVPEQLKDAFEKTGLAFFSQYKEDLGKYMPEHLNCSVDSWYWSEKGYQIASFARSSAAFTTSMLQTVGELGAKAASTASSVLQPVAVVLAPVAIVFEGKHLKNNAINKGAIRRMIQQLKNTGKVNNQSLRDQMIKDAQLFNNPKKFAQKYGGKIDYQMVQKNIQELEKRLSAIQKGTAIRWFKITGAALGGLCAGAAIIVTGGVAAVVIMGVGIASAVLTTAAMSKDIYDWSVEYDERWKLAHTLLEAARHEAFFLKVKMVGNRAQYQPEKQIVPYPTINMLCNMGLFQEPGDAIFLHFSDAFIYTQVMLAMALGNSAVATKGTPVEV